MKLYIIRHGKTQWNALNKLQGNTDIELLTESKLLAEKKGLNFKENNIHFDKVFSSPLKRAYETACLLAPYSDVKKEEALREMSFGIMEGLTYEEAQKVVPCFKYFFKETQFYCPDKDSKAETMESVLERTSRFLKEKIEPLYSEKIDNILLVAHGALNAALMSNLEKRDKSDFWGKGLTSNLEECVYEFNGKEWSKVC